MKSGKEDENELMSMKNIIRYEYEKTELNKFYPLRFDEYLLNELAKLRIQKLKEC